MSKTDGIEPRHRKDCAKSQRRANGSCCSPGIRASVWDKESGKLIRRSFSDRRPYDIRLAEARQWVLDATKDVKAGKLSATRHGGTIAGLWDEFHEGLASGAIRANHGKRYSASTVMRWDQTMRNYVVGEHGDWKADRLLPSHIEKLVETMLGRGLSASSVRNTILPLRGMYRWALRHSRVISDPTEGIGLPTDERTERHFATRDEAAAMIAALRESDRALWATAFYTGLRRGEVLGLHWEAVDLTTMRLNVAHTYHPETGTLKREAKTKKSTGRPVPIVGPLKPILLRHAVLTGRRTGLVFEEFHSQQWSMVLGRARRAWKHAELAPLTFHECRHSYVSWLIEAAAQAGEVNVQALMAIVGHSSYQMFFDTYGHLLPNAVDRVADAMEAYLGRAAG